MQKILIKAIKAKKGGKIDGTGAGTRFAALQANGFSKSFKLKEGNFTQRFDCVNVKPGDLVCFAYCYSYVRP